MKISIKNTFLLFSVIAFTSISLTPSWLEAGNLKRYENKKYGYSIEYPKRWWVGVMGPHKKYATKIKFTEERSDARFTFGAAPSGDVIEVTVENLAQIVKDNPGSPALASAVQWLAWNRSSADSSGITFTDEALTVAGTSAVKTKYVGQPKLQVTIKNPNAALVYVVTCTAPAESFDKFLSTCYESIQTFAFQTIGKKKKKKKKKK